MKYFKLLESIVINQFLLPRSSTVDRRCTLFSAVFYFQQFVDRKKENKCTVSRRNTFQGM
jgi:hypothetical protein